MVLVSWRNYYRHYDVTYSWKENNTYARQIRMRYSIIWLFLAFASNLIGAPEADASKKNENSKSSWTIDRKVDPILDTLNITAHLREIMETKSFFRLEKTLGVRCREKKFKIYVIWGMAAALGFSTESNAIDVIVRFDSEKPRKEKWSRSTNHNATFAPKADQFAKFLTKHRRLAMRTYPKEGSSLTAVFDLKEAKPVVDEVTKACAK